MKVPRPGHHRKRLPWYSGQIATNGNRIDQCGDRGGSMTIPVACAGCHRRYQVDDRFVGKTIKCAYCGQPLPIPVVEPAKAPPPPAFGEYQLDDPHQVAPSTFRARPERRTDEESTDRGMTGKKPRKRSKKKGTARKNAEPRFSLPVILISLAAVVVILALLGAFVPSVRWPVGVALTVTRA